MQVSNGLNGKSSKALISLDPCQYTLFESVTESEYQEGLNTTINKSGDRFIKRLDKLAKETTGEVSYTYFRTRMNDFNIFLTRNIKDSKTKLDVEMTV